MGQDEPKLRIPECNPQAFSSPLSLQQHNQMEGGGRRGP